MEWFPGMSIVREGVINIMIYSDKSFRPSGGVGGNDR